jgi:hypothetical protein
MLVEQAKQIDSLKEQLKFAESKLDQRDIQIKEAGNIAEAALRLNGIFEDAQAASEQYVYSLQALYAREHELCRLMEESAAKTGKAEIPPEIAERIPDSVQPVPSAQEIRISE